MLFAASCTFYFFFPAKNKTYCNHKVILSLPLERPDQYLFVGTYVAISIIPNIER